jgi:uncharacterized protein YndB with AHSA1/START domain
MKARAERELLAPPEDVWTFVSEPRHFAVWWPGLADVRPDRRGLAPGARWRVARGPASTLLHRPESEETLLVREVEPRRRFAFDLVDERTSATLDLRPNGIDKTIGRLEVEAAVLWGARRSLPRQALKRLYDLCQTAADE